MEKNKNPNSVCPQCGQKLKKCAGHKKEKPVWRKALMPLIFISCVALILTASNPTVEKNSPVNYQVATKLEPKEIIKTVRVSTGDAFLGQYILPNDDVPAWMFEEPLRQESMPLMREQALLPLINEMVRAYPIPSLREQLKKAWLDESVQKKIIFITNKAEWGDKEFPVATTMRSDENPNIPSIQFVIQAIRKRMLDAASEFEPAVARESFKDLLLAIILHEYYHAKEQDEWKIEELDIETSIRIEVECWAYTVREVIQVMKDHGRGNFTPQTTAYVAHKKYVELGGNTDSEEWMDVIRVDLKYDKSLL